MPIIKCHFKSVSLLFPTTIKVLLPSFFPDIRGKVDLDQGYSIKDKFKTLYLFHGAFDDSNSWLLKTRIQHYADKYNLAVVLPDVENSFYSDLVHGPAYWTYISEELPRFVRSILPLSDRREKNFVAGLSMGGYGALKFALKKPEMFSAVISLSGVVDIVSAFRNPIHPIFNSDYYFDGFDKLEGSDNDLFALVDRLSILKVPIPKIYIACGYDDFLINMNREFRDYLKVHSFGFSYEEGPGDHDWDFWDEYILKGLDWIEKIKV